MAFFFNGAPPTAIYTLSLHDALPIWPEASWAWSRSTCCGASRRSSHPSSACRRSEEHTSELQSHSDLVCRLLLEKKKIHYLAQHLAYSLPSADFRELHAGGFFTFCSL